MDGFSLGAVEVVALLNRIHIKCFTSVLLGKTCSHESVKNILLLIAYHRLDDVRAVQLWVPTEDNRYHSVIAFVFVRIPAMRRSFVVF